MVKARVTSVKGIVCHEFKSHVGHACFSACDMYTRTAAWLDHLTGDQSSAYCDY